MARDTSGSDSCLATILDEYAWFLDSTSKCKAEAIAWLADLDNRVEAFKHAKIYGDAIYELLRLVADPTTFRYLVI